VGSRVQAIYQADGLWYEAVIDAITDDGIYKVYVASFPFAPSPPPICAPSLAAADVSCTGLEFQITFLGYGNKQDTRLTEMREPVAAPPPKPEGEKKKRTKVEDVFETNEGMHTHARTRAGVARLSRREKVSTHQLNSTLPCRIVSCVRSWRVCGPQEPADPAQRQ
jgi:hypothetical protein